MKHLLISLLLAVASVAAPANEAAIRKAIAERVPEFPKIDEVRPTPVPGLFEVRIGNDIVYTDATGQFLLQDASLIDLKSKRNLTQARINEITAIPFASLPLKDAIVWKRGKGERQVAVFADPNCGYCKRLEATLQKLDNVTVYTFLVPILGPDSQDKSRAIWCAKDNTNVWLDWMLRNKLPAKHIGACDDAALARNTAFSKTHRITGTPALFFEDGTRVPGAMELAGIEERLKKAEKS